MWDTLSPFGESYTWCACLQAGIKNPTKQLNYSMQTSQTPYAEIKDQFQNKLCSPLFHTSLTLLNVVFLNATNREDVQSSLNN